MKPSKNIGKRIKEIRISLNLTQEEFAHEIGIESAQVSRLENGAKGTSLNRLEIICDKFGMSIDYFMMPSSSHSALKEKWIKEINIDISEMNTLQVGMIKRFVDGLKG